MQNLLYAAFGLLAISIVSGCAHNSYPLNHVDANLKRCLIEHELAHVNGWPADHPGGHFRADCPGVKYMPPHEFKPTGRKVVWHWVSPDEVTAHCGPGALACTYMGNPAHIYVPKIGN